jgi:hypothetical protein
VKPAAVTQKIDQTILNKTDVINNLIMAPRLEPLRIAPPPFTPQPLTMRPFSFQNNMAPLPQRADPYQSPFVAAVRAENTGSFVLLNGVVTRRSTTTVSSNSGTTTTKSSTSAVQIDPKTGKATKISPEEKSSEKPAPVVPPTPSPTRYGY